MSTAVLQSIPTSTSQTCRSKGSEGIKELTISRLGRVTLLAGKNGTGKTTVLEAVSVYAARGRYTDLVNVLWNREETVHVFDEDGDWGEPVPRWENLFHGRIPTLNLPISVGPSKGDSVTHSLPIISSGKIPTTDELVPILVEFQGFKREYWSRDREWRMSRTPFITDSDPPPVIQCESLGPDLPNSDQVASPLKLGQSGANRGRVALALANSKDGFLLIDEAENGIHHSIQRDFWTMILKGSPPEQRPGPGDDPQLGLRRRLRNGRNRDRRSGRRPRRSRSLRRPHQGSRIHRRLWEGSVGVGTLGWRGPDCVGSWLRRRTTW